MGGLVYQLGTHIVELFIVELFIVELFIVELSVLKIAILEPVIFNYRAISVVISILSLMSRVL